MWPYITVGIGFAFAAAFQPGPTQAFLISETLSRGWRRTLPACFFPLISDPPIFVITLLVLSRIPENLVRFLHLAGALFLFFLAVGTWRTWRSFDATRPPDTTSRHSSLRKAALVNFLNPNPWLGWSLILGPVFLDGWRDRPAFGVAVIVAFYVSMMICLAALILIFGLARNLGPRVNKAALGISVLALAGFGAWQLWLGITG